MTPKIFVPRSVKEKLPEKESGNPEHNYSIDVHAYNVHGDKVFGMFNLKSKRFISYHSDSDYEDIDFWLEEMSLEEYLKELGLKTYVFQEMPARKKSRCCGRCDGVNDVCVADTKCDPHGIYGCEVCFGER